MPRQLRGERYIKTDLHRALAKIICDELHYYDYQTAMSFYRTAIPQLDVDGSALLACNDRFYLLTGLLGRTDALHPWLYDRCREVEEEPDGHLDLWAREHYKSTIITFAGIIQEVLADPEITVGIFSHTKGIAERFLSQIMREFERNDGLRATFSDVLWSRPRTEAPSWAKSSGIILKRKNNPKEATVEAWGLVDGQPTSKHFGLLVYDDVVTRESVTNPEMVRKTTEAWELSDNLGAGAARKWHIGTRYSFADTYGVILERQILIPRIYPATHNGQINGDPVFMDAKRWAAKVKTQRSVLAAQMLQNPLAGNENTFKASWFRPYEVRPLTLNVYIVCDPSKGRSAKSDRTAIAVIGIDSAGNKYLLDGLRHRMTLSERWAALKGFYNRWTKERGVRNVTVGYEQYGMQTDLEYIQERMRAEGQSFPITEINWARDSTSQSKRDRVERLEPDMKLGRFFLPAVVWDKAHGEAFWEVNQATSHIEIRPKQGMTRQMRSLEANGQAFRIIKAVKRQDETGALYDVTRALMEEMLFFPFAPKDDMVDAVSRIYDMTPIAPDVAEGRASAAGSHMGHVDA